MITWIITLSQSLTRIVDVEVKEYAPPEMFPREQDVLLTMRLQAKLLTGFLDTVILTSLITPEESTVAAGFTWVDIP